MSSPRLASHACLSVSCPSSTSSDEPTLTVIRRAVAMSAADRVEASTSVDMGPDLKTFRARDNAKNCIPLTYQAGFVSLKGLTEQHHDHEPEQRIKPHDLASWLSLFRLVYGPVRLRAAGDFADKLTP